MKKTKVNEDLTKRDQAKYYLEIPDAGFNPLKNQEIIENSIKKYEAMRAKKKHEFDDAYAERGDAVVSYLKAIDRGGVSSGLLGYFGEKNIKMLRGDDIRAKLHEGIQYIKVRQGLKKGY